MDRIPFATMRIGVAPFQRRDPQTNAVTWGDTVTYDGRIEPRTLTGYADTSAVMQTQVSVTAYIQCDAPLPNQVKLQWGSSGSSLEAPSISVENYYDPLSGQFRYAKVIT